jgi:hypothetical protein
VQLAHRLLVLHHWAPAQSVDDAQPQLPPMQAWSVACAVQSMQLPPQC